MDTWITAVRYAATGRGHYESFYVKGNHPSRRLGVQHLRSAAEVSGNDWAYVVDTNLRGLFFCCQESGKRMVNRCGGTIVNVSSAAGVLPVKERAAYATSKARRKHADSRASAWVGRIRHYRQRGCSYVHSKLTLADRPSPIRPSEPPGPNGFRLLLATVDDVAAAVGYPVSPAAKFITGAIVPDDGGVAMR